MALNVSIQKQKGDLVSIEDTYRRIITFQNNIMSFEIYKMD